MRLGCHKAWWDQTPEEVTAVRIGSSGSGPLGWGGSLGFLGAQKVLGLGGQRKEKEKESFFLLQKVVLRRCFRV